MGQGPAGLGTDYYQRIGVSFELPNDYQNSTGLEYCFFASLYDVDTLDPMEQLDALGLADDANIRAADRGQERRCGSRSRGADPRIRSCCSSTSPPRADRERRKIKNMVLDLKAVGTLDLSHDARHVDRR